MSSQNKKGTGVKAKVLRAVLSGYCNTSQDVSDEIGVAVTVCSSYISELARAGYLKKTDRWLPNTNPVGRGCRLRVFEVVA